MSYYVVDKNQNNGHLAHYGIKGQQRGVRRFQNYDGTYTPEGLERYWPGSKHGTRGGGTYNAEIIRDPADEDGTRVRCNGREFSVITEEMPSGKVKSYRTKFNCYDKDRRLYIEGWAYAWDSEMTDDEIKASAAAMCKVLDKNDARKLMADAAKLWFKEVNLDISKFNVGFGAMRDVLFSTSRGIPSSKYGDVSLFSNFDAKSDDAGYDQGLLEASFSVDSEGKMHLYDVWQEG